MSDILEKSKQQKIKADKILDESGIINILKKYGEVKIGGSYALDVMLRPDLDIFVVTEKHDWDKVLEIQREIMRLKYFREFDFVNWVDFSSNDPDFMPGYYFQPWIPIEKELWKIDIWLITTEEDKTSELTEKFKKLLDNDIDGSKRNLILEIKEAMREKKKYKDGINGRLIYQAVLEEGVANVEDFRKKYEK